MAEELNNDWGKSVAGVVIKDGKVLLARHTYGAGKGLLITPGGYIKKGESPIDAVKREIMEETNIDALPNQIIAIRFNERDWYVAFAAEYVSGEAKSDGDENSEVLWIDTEKALAMPDVPDLSKKLIESAINAGKNGGLQKTDYNPQRENFDGFSLFSAK